MLIATLMMTTGFTMMLINVASFKDALAAAVVFGFVLREVYHVTYEQDERMDHLIETLETVH